MGNRKPGALSWVEHELWDTFLSIASGVPVIEGLSTFVEKYKSTEAKHSDDMRLDWFVKGKSTFDDIIIILFPSCW